MKFSPGFVYPHALITPTFVAAAAINGAASGTSATCALPSRTNGDLLIAYCQLPACAGGTVISADWTTLMQENGGTNGSTLLAYRVVDGTEAQPNFSWTGSAVWHSRCQQYRGVDNGVLFGQTQHANGNSSSLTASSITTTYGDSLVVAMLFAAGGFGTIALPSGYTAEVNFADDGFATDRVCGQTVRSAGGSSTAISLTGSASRQWQSFMIELKGK